MKKLLQLLGTLFMISLVFNSCNSSGKKSAGDHQFAMGMKFESKERLAGIPMASTPFGGDELPKMVDLSDKMPEVGNQGQQNSCVCWAIAYALKSYEEKVEAGKQVLFSPSFIYNQINQGQNAPTYVVDALNILANQGVCTMDKMPYNETDWVSKPSDAAKDDAKKFRIDFWRQVNVQDIKEVKAQLAAGYPVIIGAEISKEFANDGFAKKAAFVWTDPGTAEGGHCMLVVGYDDQKGAFKFINSWGKDWGDNGYGWVDYNTFPKVVKAGFVAKDAITNQQNNTDIVNTNPNNNPNTNPNTNPDNNPNNNPNNNPDNNNNNNNNINPQPYQDPTAFETIDFSSTNVEYNVQNPSDPKVGLNMKIEGRVDIPATYGRKFQIVVHIYSTTTNRQVKSNIYPTYSDVNGFAAGYTPVYDVTANGFRNGTWWIDIPYSAISMPRGRNYFYAVPTLFVDNFGIAFGDKINFYVDMP